MNKEEVRQLILEKLRDPDFVQSTLDTVYTKFCKVLRIMDHSHKFITEFPVDVNEFVGIDYNYLNSNGFHLVEIPGDLRENDTITALTEPFWTCDCKRKFVRHKSELVCGKCGADSMNCSERLPEMGMSDINATTH
jgi:hypothetical protein